MRRRSLSAMECERKGCGSEPAQGMRRLFLPLFRLAKTAVNQVDLPSVRSTIAHADQFVFLANKLRQDGQKSAEHDQPALAPHGTRRNLLGSPRRLLHNPKTLNRLRRVVFGLVVRFGIKVGVVWPGWV